MEVGAKIVFETAARSGVGAGAGALVDAGAEERETTSLAPSWTQTELEITLLVVALGLDSGAVADGVWKEANGVLGEDIAFCFTGVTGESSAVGGVGFHRGSGEATCFSGSDSGRGGEDAGGVGGDRAGISGGTSSISGECPLELPVRTSSKSFDTIEAAPVVS